MESVIGIAVIGGLIALGIAYQVALRRGMRPRLLATSLDDPTLRALFTRHVAGSTWKIVADGDPMVAQSPLIAGIRQQIAMELGEDGRYPGSTAVRVTVKRYARKTLRGTPTKAHTLRIRMNAFVRAVQHADPTAVELTDSPHLGAVGDSSAPAPTAEPASSTPPLITPLLTKSGPVTPGKIDPGSGAAMTGPIARHDTEAPALRSTMSSTPVVPTATAPMTTTSAATKRCNVCRVYSPHAAIACVACGAVLD